MEIPRIGSICHKSFLFILQLLLLPPPCIVPLNNLISWLKVRQFSPIYTIENEKRSKTIERVVGNIASSTNQENLEREILLPPLSA